MNTASWVILFIVLAIVGAAAKATFFAKKKGGCCDAGDEQPLAKPGATCCDRASSGCGGCTACSGAAAKNTLKPIVHDV